MKLLSIFFALFIIITACYADCASNQLHTFVDFGVPTPGKNVDFAGVGGNFQCEGMVLRPNEDFYANRIVAGTIYDISKSGIVNEYATIPVPSPATSLSFGIAIDSAGNLFNNIFDLALGNSSMYMVPASDPGNPVRIFPTDDHPGATVIWLNGITVDKFDNVYVADTVLGTLWRLTPLGDGTYIESIISSGGDLLGDPLTISGFPPAGSVDIVIDNKCEFIYSANLDRGLVSRIRVASPSIGLQERIADFSGLAQVPGLDGLAIDADDEILFFGVALFDFSTSSIVNQTPAGIVYAVNILPSCFPSGFDPITSLDESNLICKVGESSSQIGIITDIVLSRNGKKIYTTETDLLGFLGILPPQGGKMIRMKNSVFFDQCT